MPHTVTILTSGTHGDIVPYIVLAHELHRAGYHAQIATHPVFAPLIRACGVPFVPVDHDPHSVLAQHPGALTFDGNAVRSAAATARYLRAMQPVFGAMLRDAWRACQGSDVLIVTLATAWGQAIAERLGIPHAWALLQPWSRTAAFPTVFQPWRRSLGAAGNRATHRVVEHLVWQGWRGAVNRWRRDTLALPPLGASGPFADVYRDGTPIVYGFSAHVVPRPKDWPPSHVVTGYWVDQAPPRWQPPADLERFLAAGPPPVAVGWGSMSQGHGVGLLPHVLHALQQAGQRAVLVGDRSMWTNVRLPHNVFAIDAVPHSWLFERVAVAIHHGGAGTTAASLRAGVPTVVVPFGVDQFFWGERVHTLGAGPAPVPARTLTAHRLATAIGTAINDPVIRCRAHELAQHVRAEKGVANAVALLAQRWT